jgi:hypothetical protein
MLYYLIKEGRNQMRIKCTHLERTRWFKRRKEGNSCSWLKGWRMFKDQEWSMSLLSREIWRGSSLW